MQKTSSIEKKTADSSEAEARDHAVVSRADDIEEFPSENSESSEATKGPRQVIKQASTDIKRGLRDSERRGIPSDVPTGKKDSVQTKGTTVPPDGVDRKL